MDLGALAAGFISGAVQVLQAIKMWIVSQGGYITLGLCVISFFIGKFSNTWAKGLKSLATTLFIVVLLIGLFIAVVQPGLVGGVLPPGDGNETDSDGVGGFFDDGNESSGNESSNVSDEDIALSVVSGEVVGV